MMESNRESVVGMIASVLNDTLRDKGESPRKIDEETVILGGDLPIDSLDLAGILVQLEGLTKVDPFAGGFIMFRTVGELTGIYQATMEEAFQ